MPLQTPRTHPAPPTKAAARALYGIPRGPNGLSVTLLEQLVGHVASQASSLGSTPPTCITHDFQYDFQHVLSHVL